MAKTIYIKNVHKITPFCNLHSISKKTAWTTQALNVYVIHIKFLQNASILRKLNPLNFALFYWKFHFLDHFNLWKSKWPVHPTKTQISLGICPVWSVFAVLSMDSKGPKLSTVDSDDSNLTGWMQKLIWVFAGRTCHFVGFVMRLLKRRLGTKITPENKIAIEEFFISIIWTFIIDRAFKRAKK